MRLWIIKTYINRFRHLLCHRFFLLYLTEKLERMITPEPKFVLKDPNSKKLTLINMIVRFNNERIVYSTGERILKANWDKKGHRAYVNRTFLEGSQINDELERCKQKCREVFRNFTYNQREVKKEEIKIELDKLIRGHIPKAEVDVYFTDYIKLLSDSTNHSKWTKISYNNTREHILSFEDSKRCRYKIKNIDLLFYDSIIRYLIDKRLSKNTIAKIIKNIKVFLLKAMDSGLIPENRALLRKMSKQEEETTKIYLNKDEIKAIYELDLSSNKKFERVRDLFVLACNVGLRFSDFVTIKRENINITKNGSGIEKTLLNIKTQKTNKYISVPLNSQALAILEKYDWHIPKSISNQKMNEYLKDIGAAAKLSEKVQIVITQGGERNISTKEKRERITTHTARRSFASNLFMDGVPSLQIMKLTGHKTERAFLKYIRVSAEENALKMADLDFFS